MAPLRVVAIVDLSVPLARIVAALAAHQGGEVALQLRDKRADGGALLATGRALRAALPDLPLLINDRVDVALALGAGVHLPEHGLAIADARALGVTVVGVSRHDPRDAAAALAAGADLVHLGPIWATPSKAGMGEPLGPGALALGAHRGRLVAVGGIEGPPRARAARAAGADAVAAIRAIWTAADPAAAITALLEA